MWRQVQFKVYNRKLPLRREKLDRIYIFGLRTLQSTESFQPSEPRYIIGPLFEIVTTVVFHYNLSPALEFRESSCHQWLLWSFDLYMLQNIE